MRTERSPSRHGYRRADGAASEEEKLARDQHEGRLEARFRVRQVKAEEEGEGIASVEGRRSKQCLETFPSTADT